MTLHEETFIPALNLGVEWQVRIAERFTEAGLEINSLDSDPSAATRLKEHRHTETS